MSRRKKFIIFSLLVLIILSVPGTALAGFDEYGYNAKARKFKGTLENWENLLLGRPAVPWDFKAKNVVFLERKWDKRFDAMMSGNPPTAPGAWQKASLWEYLSGDQEGWTWNLELEIVYSPNKPIKGAVELSPQEMGGFTGFYLVHSKEWLKGPKGKKVVIEQTSGKSQASTLQSSILQRALRFSK